MDEIKSSISRYCIDFESIREDIISGIKEGVEEGIKEGIKKGFLDGIKDCLKLGFFKIGKHEIKSFKKILVDAFGNASEKSIRLSIKKIVRSKYKSILDPSFKKYMETACNNVVEEIRNSKIRLDSSGAKDIKILVSFSTNKINEKFEKIGNDVREKLPTDAIFGSAVDGIQDGLQETINENIKICEERFNREIDKKIISVVV